MYFAAEAILAKTKAFLTFTVIRRSLAPISRNLAQISTRAAFISMISAVFARSSFRVCGFLCRKISRTAGEITGLKFHRSFL